MSNLRKTLDRAKSYLDKDAGWCFTDVSKDINDIFQELTDIGFGIFAFKEGNTIRISIFNSKGFQYEIISECVERVKDYMNQIGDFKYTIDFTSSNLNIRGLFTGKPSKNLGRVELLFIEK